LRVFAEISTVQYMPADVQVMYASQGDMSVSQSMNHLFARNKHVQIQSTERGVTT